MKIVVIGGTGLIGSKVLEKLKQKDHEAIAAAPSTGVNIITGEGLAKVLTGAEVVIDVANSPSFEDRASMDFFQTAGKNLTPAEASSITSPSRSSERSACRKVATFVPNWPRRASSRARRSPTRLSTPSSSCARLPSFRPTATQCACRPCCSSQWRQKIFRQRIEGTVGRLRS